MTNDTSEALLTALQAMRGSPSEPIVKSTAITDEEGNELFTLRYRPITRYMTIKATQIANEEHRKRTKDDKDEGVEGAVLEKELARMAITQWRNDEVDFLKNFDVAWENMDIYLGEKVSVAIGIKDFIDSQKQGEEVEAAKN